MASQAFTKARNAKAKKARKAQRAKVRRAWDELVRERDGARKVNALAGSRAKRKSEERKAERERKKADKKAERDTLRDARRDAAIERQRVEDRRKRDMKRQADVDDDEERQDEAEKPRGPWEEQPVRETGSLKGRVVGSFDASTKDWANLAQSAVETAETYLFAGNPSDIEDAKLWCAQAISYLSLVRSSFKKFRQRAEQ